MARRELIATGLLGLLAFACGGPDLSDRDLLRYAATRYDANALQNRRIRLGTHRGTAVLVDFPCVSSCPEYTRRLIHYDVAPGEACESMGGVTDSIDVDIGKSTFVVRDFCVPKVLAGKSDLYR